MFSYNAQTLACPSPYICIENKTRKIMKTKSVLMVALMAMSVSVFAANEPVNSRIAVLTQESGIFKVIYESVKAGKVTLTITDRDGNVVYKEGIKTVNGFIRPVNFNGMDLGVYTIAIADATGEQIQTVNYQSDFGVKHAHVARIAEEGKYLLAVASQGAGQINVKIFDGENNLVHNQNLAVNGDFGLVFNLKQVVGTPSFEVTDNRGNNLLGE
jgi:hypothetical protein